MAENYLLKYISRKLQTCVTHYHQHNLIKSYCDNFDIIAHYQNCQEILEYPLLTLGNHSCPKIITYNNNIVFSLIKYKQDIYIIGPLKALNSTALKHQFQSQPLDLSQLVNTLPTNTLMIIVEYSLLLHNCLHNYELNQEEIWISNFRMTFEQIKGKSTALLFNNREHAQHHNSYQQELREQNSIAQGDLVKLKQSWEEVYTGEIGILADNELRNFKNLAIVVITLASRSAMKGGVPPEIAYSMSDQFISAVETLTSLEEIIAHIRQSEIEFTLLVKQYTKQNSLLISPSDSAFFHPFVTKAQTYITEHLHQPITSEEVAQAIPCSSSYLTQLFQKELNTSIQNYIYQEKMTYAEQLLIYTELSLSEITTSLGYSSQSYFGKVFKKFSNYSPLYYRMHFGKF
ncbi:helix-turn-helix transcriptional regulator [Streptococcus sp. S784/96/1]|uniref:helix-turn-helix transcriptional regulator n=1 Tax=Streptococcus sp. S784/96/1 TaxID=2653499 RepID=UPI001389957A|nr:AraC family transcriptional regulator [Streptococcus sp. S784/96/1]